MSAKGVTNPMSLEENLAAEARLDETTGMLDTTGLKETIETDMIHPGVVTTGTIATTEGGEAQKGVEVATGTREEDSAAIITKPSMASHLHPQEVVILMLSLVRLRCISEDGIAVNYGKHWRAQVTVSFVPLCRQATPRNRTSRPHSALIITIDTRVFVRHAKSQRKFAEPYQFHPRKPSLHAKHILLR
jgi:hypothetical protein